MQYMGSKNRLAKYIVPIIQSYITADTKGYLEPFVGGANVIDKVDCSNKVGCDIHEYLIALLNQAKANTAVFPKSISFDEYYDVKENKHKYPDWYVGMVGFCGSHSGKWFNGYARGNDIRDRQNEAIRNISNQSKRLQDINFKCADFRLIEDIKNYVVYCDPPYKGTTKYKTEAFPYEEFYEWVKEMSIHNTVLISEYNMPDEFECIWQKETTTQINSKREAGDENNVRIERLYTYKAS